MSNGIYSALSGAIAQQRLLDVVANNVANANTVAFRGDRVAFREALSNANQSKNRPDPQSFSLVRHIQTDTSSGAVRPTGNVLDMAIQGGGFFSVETPQGLMFTRNGSFHLDQDQTLRTSRGDAVLNDSQGSIQIPYGTKQVEVTQDGWVNADGNQIARLGVVEFADARALTKVGNNYWTAGPGVPRNDGDSSIVVQGSLESPNVNAISGMNELITASRSFDVYQRVIQTYKQLDERAAKELAAR